jgi:hypothetical protein
MGTFIVAYSILWLVLVLYVGRIGIALRRLKHEVDNLRSRIGKHEKALRQHTERAA